MSTEKKLTGYPSIDKPWLKYHDAEAINALLPECTMYDYIWQNNKDYLNDIALIYFNKKITYGKMFEMIDKTAKAFLSIGVKAGDICTVLMLNQPEMVYVLYALNKIGAVCCVVNVLSSEKELVHYLEEGNSKYFIALDVFFEKAYNAAKSCWINKLIYVPLWQSLGAIRNKIYRFKVKEPQATDSFVISWDSFMQKSNVNDFEAAAYEDGKCTVIGHTGGTTGTPKGVMLTDKAFNSIAMQERTVFNFNRQDTFLDLIVPFAVYGLSNNLHVSLSFGLKVILIPKVDPETTDELLYKYKPNHIASIPSYWTAVVKSKKLKDVSWLKTAAAGGSGMTIELEKELNEFLKVHNSKAHFMNGYGMSEVCGGVCLQTRDTAEIGSVGIPLCKVVISAFDTDTLEEKKVNEEGELCIKGPSMMLGYIANEAETAQTIRAHEDGMWIHTGDVGYVNENGIVFVKGRIKRMYITQHNGLVSKIFPDRIEKTVLKHPAIEDCCSVCIPKEDNTYIPIVYLVLKNQSDNQTSIINEVSELCKADLPEYAQPVEYKFRESLPLTPIGKVDYRALEQEAAVL